MPKPTILLIDANPAEAERLAAAGFDVEVARDGVEGMQAFERLAPALVVVDAILPKKHGLDVCREIKTSDRGKGIPVVMTIDGEQGRQYGRDTLLSFGCDDLVEKPADVADLIAACRRLLGEPEPAGGPADTAEGVLEDLVQELDSIPLAVPAAPEPAAVEAAPTRDDEPSIPLARDAVPVSDAPSPPVPAAPRLAPSVPSSPAAPVTTGAAPPQAGQRAKSAPPAGETAGTPSPPMPAAPRPATAVSPSPAVPAAPRTAQPAPSSPAAPAATRTPVAPATARPGPVTARPPAAARPASPPARDSVRRPAPPAAAPGPAAATPPAEPAKSAPMSDSEIVDHVDSLLGDGSPSRGGGVKWMLIVLVLAVVGGGVGYFVLSGGRSDAPAEVARTTRPVPARSPTPARTPTPVFGAADAGAPVDAEANAGEAPAPNRLVPDPGALAAPVAGGARPDDARTDDERGAATVAAHVARPVEASRPSAGVAPARVEVPPETAVRIAPAQPAARPSAAPAPRPVAPPSTAVPGSVETTTTPTPTPAASRAENDPSAAARSAAPSPTNLVASLSNPSMDRGSGDAQPAALDTAPAEVAPFVEPVAVAYEPPAPVIRTPSVRRGELVELADVDVAPAPLERPAPEYDAFARRLRQQGTVTVRVLIDADGRVTDTELVEGIPRSRLNDSALAAVRDWTYRPAEKAGVPVKVWIVEAVRFRL